MYALIHPPGRPRVTVPSGLKLSPSRQWLAPPSSCGVSLCVRPRGGTEGALWGPWPPGWDPGPIPLRAVVVQPNVQDVPRGSGYVLGLLALLSLLLSSSPPTISSRTFSLYLSPNKSGSVYPHPCPQGRPAAHQPLTLRRTRPVPNTTAPGEGVALPGGHFPGHTSLSLPCPTPSLFALGGGERASSETAAQSALSGSFTGDCSASLRGRARGRKGTVWLELQIDLLGKWMLPGGLQCQGPPSPSRARQAVHDPPASPRHSVFPETRAPQTSSPCLRRHPFLSGRAAPAACSDSNPWGVPVHSATA